MSLATPHRSGPGPARPFAPLLARACGAEQQVAITAEKPELPEPNRPIGQDENQRVRKVALFNEVLLNPGLCLLVGAIVVGFISALQGQKVIHDDDTFFVSAFQGALCLFLLEMGMTASRKLKDLRSAGFGFILFGLLAPNIFATLGIIVARGYSYYTNTEFKPGTYVLFAVLCGAASYIAVPAVQRLAIPEASPTLPLAASLGLTFSYNVPSGYRCTSRSLARRLVGLVGSVGSVTARAEVQAKVPNPATPTGSSGETDAAGMRRCPPAHRRCPLPGV